MELLFLLVLVLIMALALGSGYPVAFALPGAAILTISLAAITGVIFAGDTDAFFAHGGPGQWLSAGVTNLRGLYWEPERDTLIAIPLFIFMGIMLQRSRIAEDLLITMAQLFGPIPGGLGISVVFVGALLAATTGIVGATVVAMGLISLPAMLRNNYSRPLATGTIAASGTLGQIIPPSIVLIILADQLASAADQAGTARTNLYKEATGELTMPTDFAVSPTSAGEMFLGAFIPGIVLVILYMAFILIFALIRPKVAPAVSYEGNFDRAFLVKVLVTLVPPLTLILLVLGSILAGIATVNQAGAIGAAGALIMAGYKLTEGQKNAYVPGLMALGSLIAIGIILSIFDINVKSTNTSHDVLGLVLASIAVGVLIVSLIWSGWRAIKVDNTMYGVVVETSKTTSLVFIILLGAAMLTAAFRAFGGEELVREFLTGLPGGFWVQFFIVMAVIFVLGFFLDFIEIAVVVVPIVAPILLSDPGANITAVWLGVMIGLNIQTSFLTPPFGFALFYLRGVADRTVKTLDMYKGVIPFITLQLVALFIVAFNPPLVNYLPQRVSLLSETAPPPRNPQLQYCIEEEMHGIYVEQRDPIMSAIASARTLDLGYMPRDISKKLTESFDSGESVFGLIEEVRKTQDVVIEASPAYKPLHDVVRDLEGDARKIAKHLEEEETQLSRTRGDDDIAVQRRERLEASIAVLKAEEEALLAQIPEEWSGTYERFAELNKAETNARRQYRRAADGAYEGIAEVMNVIRAGKGLTALIPEIEALRGIENMTDKDQIKETVEAVTSKLSPVAGAGSIASLLSGARRDLTANTPRTERAIERLNEALDLARSESAWRAEASENALPELEKLEETIRNNIGLRMQRRMPRDLALRVASCRSNHRDVSLSF